MFLKENSKKKTTKIYFIVMANVFATTNHIDLRFDLKGSSIGRKVLTGTIDDSKIFANGDMALKDLDFNKLNERVNISSKREKILEQLKKDVEFLYKINSNDYSLLLGIHCIKPNKDMNYDISATTMKSSTKKEDFSSILTGYTSEFLLSNSFVTESTISSEQSAIERINKLKGIYDYEDGGILSDDKKRIYYFGIIDILTEFNTSKKIEYLFKTFRYCSHDMSCIPPFYYKQRFYNYLFKIFPEQNNINKEKNNNNENIPVNIKKCFQVDKFGAISSSNYKSLQKEYDKKVNTEDSQQIFQTLQK